MEIIGKVIKALPIKKGVSAKSGKEWRIFEFVIETEGQYPKKALLRLWNEDIDEFGKLCDPRLGKVLKVWFDIDANEYNGRYFNELKAWKVAEDGATEASNPARVENNQPSKASVTDFAQPSGNAESSASVPAEQVGSRSDSGDELPF